MDEEIVRSIRRMEAAEYERIQLYMQPAESTDYKLAVAVLKDIADDKRVQIGEFPGLLRVHARMKKSSLPRGQKK